MAAKTLSSIVGGSHGYRLAVDTNSYTDRTVGRYIFTQVTSIDTTAGLTEILGLSGKFIVILIELAALIANDLDKVKLTIDGVVIWNSTGITVNHTHSALISSSTSLISLNTYGLGEAVIVDTSLSLEIEMNTDTAISINYVVRPIL